MVNDTTLSLYVIKLIEVLNEKGIQAHSYLKQAAITAQELSERNERIALHKYISFVESVLANNPIEDLGFRVGQKTNILDHGVLGYSLLSSANLEESLQRYVRFQHLVGPVLQVGFYIEGDRACLTAAPKRGDWRLSTEALRYFSQEWLSVWVQWNELIGLRNDFLDNVELGFIESGNLDHYRRYLHCPIEKNSYITRAWFSSSLLKNSLEFGDKVMGELCVGQCERLLNTQQKSTGLLADIQWRLTNTPGSIPNMEVMAKQLCVSSRTLRRYLKDEGTTYQQVILDFRIAMAQGYLIQSPFSANDIADLVGYSNTANFYRIFKREVGLTPQQFRDNKKSESEMGVELSREVA